MLNQIKFFIVTAASGILAHFGLWAILRMGNKGETGGAGASAAASGASTSSGEKTFTQDDVNNLIARERKTIQEKYNNYDDLVKYKTEQENLAKQREEQNLEQKQEYDKLKQGWESEKKSYTDRINELQNSINNEKINNAITNEVIRQNAFPEATSLIRSLAKLNEDGSVVIHGKNDQGILTDLDVEVGVKQFLKEKPFLVKANQNGGAGTSAAGDNSGGAGQLGGNQGDLGDQLQQARAMGDFEKVNKIKAQIRAKMGGATLLK